MRPVEPDKLAIGHHSLGHLKLSTEPDGCLCVTVWDGGDSLFCCLTEVEEYCLLAFLQKRAAVRRKR